MLVLGMEGGDSVWWCLQGAREEGESVCWWLQVESTEIFSVLGTQGEGGRKGRQAGGREEGEWGLEVDSTEIFSVLGT